jgi:hypothetical protein
MVLPTPHSERRSANRLVSPDSPRCGEGTRVIGIVRTACFVYFRCKACDELVVKAIPALPGSGWIAQNEVASPS